MPAIEKFKEITTYEPNDMQRAMWQRVTSEDCAVLLKSPTGTGKTESVLVPALASGRRLFMIYPTRSLVEDQIQRAESVMLKLSDNGKQFSLVIDTGGESRRRVFRNKKEITDQQFNSRRHLYDGDVIISTLDKFLYRFFGFGDERKGYIFPFRIFHGLKRNLFVFDEAHAYEDTAFTNFLRLIKALYIANLDVVLMTATMPKSYAAEFDFLETVDFLADQQPHAKTLKYRSIFGNLTITDAIVSETQSRINDRKRLIVTVETVEDAVKVWNKLGKPLLYHGRLDNSQRKKVYEDLKRREQKGDGYLLVTTSAIEVGCDLNADYLITEFCNPASLIQRAGRCNRRGDRSSAEVVVVGNKIKNFLREISEEQEVGFVESLNRKSDSLFLPSDFLDFTQRGVAFDYRAEIMFDMLFEYVYQSRLENKPLHDKGLVVTRSWEPTITLTTDKSRMHNAVSVPISRCTAYTDKDWQKGVKVYARYFNKYGNEYDVVLRELEYGGFAYFRDLVIEVPKETFDAQIGYLDLPKPFLHAFPVGYKERLLYQPMINGDERKVWLHYLRWAPEAVEQEIVEDAETDNEDSDETEE
ncbi:MAG: CRISPR-associated helicase Cas3' [Chloroflexi bacterium]|nr:CRISPR-associated helicase Cas3' [Chloroflexota bacterium]MDL1940947.1 CRISPR-associated helicase Cas3' [Chloroflexi bacterium CFX2]